MSAMDTRLLYRGPFTLALTKLSGVDTGSKKRKYCDMKAVRERKRAPKPVFGQYPFPRLQQRRGIGKGWESRRSDHAETIVPSGAVELQEQGWSCVLP